VDFQVFDGATGLLDPRDPFGKFVYEAFHGACIALLGGIPYQSRREAGKLAEYLEGHAPLGADGAVDEFLEIAFRDHATVIDDHDAFGALLGFVEMVGCQDDGGPQIAQFVQHIKDALAALRIHTDGGFIQEQDAGPMQDAAGDVDATFHAAGETSGQFMGSIFEGDPMQCPVDPIAKGTAPQAVIASKTEEIFARGQVVVDRKILRDDPQLMVGSNLPDGAAKDLDRTGIGADPSADAPDQRCLASPVGSQKCDPLPWADAERNTLQGFPISEGLVEVLHRQRQFRRIDLVAAGRRKMFEGILGGSKLPHGSSTVSQNGIFPQSRLAVLGFDPGSVRIPHWGRI
jgi:hypothetical protein